MKMNLKIIDDGVGVRASCFNNLGPYPSSRDDNCHWISIPALLCLVDDRQDSQGYQSSSSRSDFVK